MPAPCRLGSVGDGEVGFDLVGEVGVVIECRGEVSSSETEVVDRPVDSILQGDVAAHQTADDLPDGRSSDEPGPPAGRAISQHDQRMSPGTEPLGPA